MFTLSYFRSLFPEVLFMSQQKNPRPFPQPAKPYASVPLLPLSLTPSALDTVTSSISPSPLHSAWKAFFLNWGRTHSLSAFRSQLPWYLIQQPFPHRINMKHPPDLGIVIHVLPCSLFLCRTWNHLIYYICICFLLPVSPPLQAWE